MAELDKVAIVFSLVSLIFSLVGVFLGLLYYRWMRKNMEDLKKIMLAIKNGR